jgi:hypothetical protein
VDGETIPFQEIVVQSMCPRCPVAEIPDEYWQANVHEGIIYEPQDLTEILGNFKDQMRSPDRIDLAGQLNSVHDYLLSLFPSNFEDGRFKTRFPSGEVRLTYGKRQYLAETELPTTSQAFLGCMRRLVSGQCSPGADVLDMPGQKPIPFGLISDISLGADVLETIGKHGTQEEVRNLVEKILDIADETGDSVLREYINVHAYNRGDVVDRAVILAAALFLRERNDRTIE